MRLLAICISSLIKCLTNTLFLGWVKTQCINLGLSFLLQTFMCFLLPSHLLRLLLHFDCRHLDLLPIANMIFMTSEECQGGYNCLDQPHNIQHSFYYLVLPHWLRQQKRPSCKLKVASSLNYFSEVNFEDIYLIQSPNVRILILIYYFNFLFYFGATTGNTQGLLLVLPQESLLIVFRNHMQCQKWNMGQLCARQVPYSLYSLSLRLLFLFAYLFTLHLFKSQKYQGNNSFSCH